MENGSELRSHNGPVSNEHYAGKQSASFPAPLKKVRLEHPFENGGLDRQLPEEKQYRQNTV
jgi:hypothetical protein